MKETRLKIVYEGDWQIPISKTIIRCGVILSHGAVRCWGVLKTYARDKEEAYPSMKTIGNDMGISVEQAHKYVKELNSVGLIVIEKKVKVEGWGVMNVYHMADVKLWWQELGESLMKDRKKKKIKRYKKQSQTLKNYKISTD